MNIAVFGFSGFIGSHIVNVLNNEHNIIKVNARNINHNSSDKEIFDYFEEVLIDPDLIFNFCANTNPKNKNDILENFRLRINNSLEEEFHESKNQVKKIAIFRLENLFQ